MMPRLIVVFALFLSTPFLSTPLQASAQTLQGWLDRSAIPELGETLTHHPRFRGERIDIGPLVAGQPAEHGSVLGRWIEQHVSEALLDVPGIRLVSQHPECREDAPDVYLGIAIAELPGGRYRVALRFLDRAEGVWISGVGAAWEGYLTRQQRDALGQSETPAEHLPTLAESDLLAERFVHSFECRGRLPGALPPPPWRILPSDDGRLNALSAELGRRLPKRFAASERATPLTLALDTETGRLNLTSELATLASIPVYISEHRNTSTGGDDEVVEESTAELSLEVAAIEPTGICRRTQTNRCLSVRVSAPRSVRSRLLLTYERGGRDRVRSIDCRGGAAGDRQVRIAIERDIDPAPIGVYVLGTGNAALARRIDALLAQGGCDRAADEAWIADLAQLAEQADVRWQSTQVESTQLAVDLR